MAELTPEERNEYKLRYTAYANALVTFRAAQSYLVAWQTHVATKYGLPERFSVNLETGELFDG